MRKESFDTCMEDRLESLNRDQLDYLSKGLEQCFGVAIKDDGNLVIVDTQRVVHLDRGEAQTVFDIWTICDMLTEGE